MHSPLTCIFIRQAFESCCGNNREHFDKVLVFVNRQLTARYLVDALEQKFNGFVRVGCTVEAETNRPQLKTVTQRAEDLRKFSPRSHDIVISEEYNIRVVP